jgi:Replication initiator protein A
VCKNTKAIDAVGDNTNNLPMVGDNTIETPSVGDNTKDRSPLLPMRHQPDFFVCDVFDAALKGDSASMEHPIFSLSKKPDLKTRRYENGKNWAEVRPGAKGLATVFDRDILIYCISQLMAAMNDGRPISRRLHLRAYDLLISTNRDTSGRGYLQLREAFERLQGTQIATNIITGGKESFDVFSLIDRARIVRQTREGRMQEVEIVLSDWVFQAVEAQEVLTLDRRYFQLAKPLERRLYELARKHVGQQASFKIGLEKLRGKCGAQSTLKEFRRLLQTIIADDTAHNHMPGYSLALDSDGLMVEMRAKAGFSPTLPSSMIQLNTGTFKTAREYLPNFDIYTIESEWRAWIAKKGITPHRADAHFLAFCKRRATFPNFK